MQQKEQKVNRCDEMCDGFVVLSCLRLFWEISLIIKKKKSSHTVSCLKLVCGFLRTPRTWARASLAHGPSRPGPACFSRSIPTSPTSFTLPQCCRPFTTRLIPGSLKCSVSAVTLKNQVVKAYTYNIEMVGHFCFQSIELYVIH